MKISVRGGVVVGDNLARLLAARVAGDEGRQLVAAVHGWFTEGRARRIWSELFGNAAYTAHLSSASNGSGCHVTRERRMMPTSLRDAPADAQVREAAVVIAGEVVVKCKTVLQGRV